MTDIPVTVPASPLTPMLMTLGRDVLKLIGAALVTHGYLTAGMEQELSGIIIAAAPTVYSQFKTLWNQRKMKAMADNLPDTKAVAK